MLRFFFCCLLLWQLPLAAKVHKTHLHASWSPDKKIKAIKLTGWRGERLSATAWIQVETAAKEPLRLRLKSSQKAGCRLVVAEELHTMRQSSIGFISDILTDSFNTCGQHPEGLTPYPIPDIIETDTALVLQEGTLKPLWCTIEIPYDIQAGNYQLQVEAIGTKSRKPLTTLQLEVEVLGRSLPTPEKTTFHTDFWQQPYAVSRYYHVERWSQQHFDLLRPYLQLLARAGQSVATAILFYEPWGDQSHDKFDAMIKTRRDGEGNWHYDYTVFDHWIELCDSCGINRQINCYSMVPWDMSFQYEQEVNGGQDVKEITLKTTTDSQAYRELWIPFLQAFARHLKKKGWFEKTCIAMDERGLKNMLDAYEIAHEAVPDIKMALAGNRHEELVDKLFDYCIPFGHHFTPQERTLRKEKGMITTMYTCCTESFPNIFSNSQPIEGTFLPLYAVANGFDGYLHWSWMNWNDDPLHDTRYRLFGSGDTFCIYPGPRSSVRFEHYIKGVQLAEKVRILLIEYQGAKRQKLSDALNAFKAVPHSAEEIKQLVDNLELLVNTH